MCGLICLISKNNTGFTEQELNIFKLGLYATAVRGTDSTGVFLVTSDGNLQLIKDTTQSSDFIRTKEYNDLESDAYTSGRILVGHCRAATKGIKTDQNAHPFISDNIALVHNGTLWAHKYLADTNTDSEAIAKAFSKNDPTEIIPDLLGAYALLWYDAKNTSFHASRNKERPLWILQTPSIDFIGSEPGLLEWLYTRTYNSRIDAKYFETDKIFSWDLSKLEDSFTETQLIQKVIPVPTVYTHEKKTYIHKNYSYGERVRITVAQIEEDDTMLTIIGTDIKNPETIFRCSVVNTALCAEKLRTCDEFMGSICGLRRLEQSPVTLLVSDPFPLTPLKNTSITQEDINNNTKVILQENSYCSRCNCKITEKNSKQIVFKLKNRTVKKSYCTVCLKSFEKKDL